MLQLYLSYNTPPVSTGDHTNPIIIVADGGRGEYILQRLFLHNDDPSIYYRDVTIWVENIPDNWSIKLIAQKDRPTEEQWAQVTSGNSISFAQIGSREAPDLNYHPFWIRAEVAPGSPTQTILNASLRARMTECIR